MGEVIAGVSNLGRPSADAEPRVRRFLPAVMRRLRLCYARLRHPRISWGQGCDVHGGLWIRSGRDAVIEFGEKCVIDRFMTIECHGQLSVGARTILGHHCTIASHRSIRIGNDCLIAEMVSIRDHDHRFGRLDMPTREQGMTCAPVKIGNNVWLGAKVTVVKGVTIGDNVVVGANAVVTRDIPANAVAMGIPARVVRMRDGATNDA